MTSVISKIFCLSNCDGIEAAIQQYTRNHTCDVVPDFELRRLVDDDFIAGFCMRGEVTVIPLQFSHDLHFTVKNSELSIYMSPTVYAGFGMPCEKIKEKPRMIYYRFRHNLNSPTFRRNSSIHQCLQRFFSSSSDPVESLRVPPHVLAPRPCLVYWNPAPRTVHTSPDGQQSMTPLGESLARFLSPDTYCKVQNLTEILHFTSPVSLPWFLETPSDACVLSSDSELPTECATMESRINLAKAQAAYHMLSCLSTGIWPLSSDADNNENAFINPCLVEPGLAPFMTMEFREVQPVAWSIGSAVRIQITGLFLPEHVSQLEAIVHHTVKTHEADKRTFAFFATRRWPLQPSLGNSSALGPKVEANEPVAKLFLKLPREETSDDDFITMNFR